MRRAFRAAARTVIVRCRGTRPTRAQVRPAWRAARTWPRSWRERRRRSPLSKLAIVTCSANVPECASVTCSASHVFVPDPPTCQQSGSAVGVHVGPRGRDWRARRPAGAVGSGPHGGASPPPITWCTVCTETPVPAFGLAASPGSSRACPMPMIDSASQVVAARGGITIDDPSAAVILSLGHVAAAGPASDVDRRLHRVGRGARSYELARRRRQLLANTGNRCTRRARRSPAHLAPSCRPQFAARSAPRRPRSHAPLWVGEVPDVEAPSPSSVDAGCRTTWRAASSVRLTVVQVDVADRVRRRSRCRRPEERRSRSPRTRYSGAPTRPEMMKNVAVHRMRGEDRRGRFDLVGVCHRRTSARRSTGAGVRVPTAPCWSEEGRGQRRRPMDQHRAPCGRLAFVTVRAFALVGRTRLRRTVAPVHRADQLARSSSRGIPRRAAAGSRAPDRILGRAGGVVEPQRANRAHSGS